MTTSFPIWQFSFKIDEASAEVLERAVAELDRTRLMVLVTHRPDYVTNWRTAAALTQLTLRRLPDAAAVEIMRAIAGGPLPEELENGTINCDATSLMNNSNIITTAWVSENSSLLRRLDINSTLIITPQILNISSPDFRIVSRFNESTVYNDFGVPIKIELPKPALKAPSKELGVNWRWAVFGSIRP